MAPPGSTETTPKHQNLRGLALFKREAIGFNTDIATILTQLRQLDEQQAAAQAVVESTMATCTADLAGAKKPTATQFRNMQRQVEQQHDAVIALTTEKVQLASRLYDLVDARIVALTKENVAMDEDIQKAKLDTGVPLESSAQFELRNLHPSELDKLKPHVKKKVLRDDVYTPVVLPAMATEAEPTYCYCHGVSEGEMIGCDNEDCDYGWFHYKYVLFGGWGQCVCLGVANNTFPCTQVCGVAARVAATRGCQVVLQGMQRKAWHCSGVEFGLNKISSEMNNRMYSFYLINHIVITTTIC